uniref:Uncharacterized protein n=1 Tax=Panagrolaimus superbus TaxID=310955 RepID=A0A914Z5I9_9BILA
MSVPSKTPAGGVFSYDKSEENKQDKKNEIEEKKLAKRLTGYIGTLKDIVTSNRESNFAKNYKFVAMFYGLIHFVVANKVKPVVADECKNIIKVLLKIGFSGQCWGLYSPNDVNALLEDGQKIGIVGTPEEWIPANFVTQAFDFNETTIFDDDILSMAKYSYNSAGLLSLIGADPVLRSVALNIAKSEKLLLDFIVGKDDNSFNAYKNWMGYFLTCRIA